MTPAVQHLAAVAEQAEREARLVEQATALAKRWRLDADGKPSMAVIIAALMVRRIVADEAASDCGCPSEIVLAAALDVLARVSGVGE